MTTPVELNVPLTCRPQKLTCRWLTEITTAINILCPLQKPVLKCSEDTVGETEKLWAEYINSLQESKCVKNPTVLKVLRYEIDYKDISYSNGTYRSYGT